VGRALADWNFRTTICEPIHLTPKVGKHRGEKSDIGPDHAAYRHARAKEVPGGRTTGPEPVI
jgi:hypothetical protein